MGMWTKTGSKTAEQLHEKLGYKLDEHDALFEAPKEFFPCCLPPRMKDHPLFCVAMLVIAQVLRAEGILL